MNKQRKEDLQQIADYIAEMSEKDRSNFCQDVSVFLISVLRGIEGDKFIKGFLYGAMSDDLILKKKEH